MANTTTPLRFSLFSTHSSTTVSLFPSSSAVFRQSIHRRSTPQPSLSLTNKRVSTASVEQQSAATPEFHSGFNFSDEIARLKSLRTKLSSASSLSSKLRVIDFDSRVREFFGNCDGSGLLKQLNSREVFLLKGLVAAGQQHVLGVEMELAFGGCVSSGERSGLKSAIYALADMVEKWSIGIDGCREIRDGGGGGGMLETLRRFLKMLDDIELFYDCIGGIIGYQIVVLDLISSTKAEQTSQGKESLEFHVPRGLNLMEDLDYASQAALWGIEGLPALGEIYPLGGAADRLGLVDPETGECLPAALLPYCGRTLLEGLIRDLQAREFLYFKIYRKQCITPVAIMTSSVKNNHNHIMGLCEKLGWFGRGSQAFQLFEQPLVPVVAAEDGQWLIHRPLIPVCKPGGHGAIWKLAYDKGIFRWFYSHGRKGAIVRQVSNVVAATDLTLLALAGFGLRHGKKLGFASCQRNAGATEGINVLIEKQNLNRNWEYGITCIEYTEFEKFGLTGPSLSNERLQAGFPANTNILYIDLKSVEEVGSSQSTSCLPGMVLNLKKPIVYDDELGIRHSVSGGRLECTMQNIADNFLNAYPSKCDVGIENTLDTFIVYNERKRVTSSTKRRRKATDKSLHQTPDGSLLDIMRNAFDLLSCCDIDIPKVEDNCKYFSSGPPFLILLHPAIGPLWEVARQKFCGGSISEGSELQVEVAEFLWKDVVLDGSLRIVAENVMGSINLSEHGEPILQYGQRCGRCRLQNVKILNKSIDWNSPNNVYWKHDVRRHESLKIILEGNAEFEATDVVLEGNHIFEIPNGFRMHISPDDSDKGFLIKLDPIREEMMDSGSWFWEYQIKGVHIHLEMVQL